LIVQTRDWISFGSGRQKARKFWGTFWRSFI
jgi:hypothetical protein